MEGLSKKERLCGKSAIAMGSLVEKIEAAFEEDDD